MQCTIAGNDVKFLGRSIHSLARIGEDMYIETKNDVVLFQTVNSARSAYASFIFKSPFFKTFTKSNNVKCKLSLKSWLMIFRHIPSVEKDGVETCLIDTTSVPDAVLVEFAFDTAVKKTCHLPFIENESVQAEFPSHAFQCKFTAQSRLLIDGIQNFGCALEEITLSATNDRLTLKNYADDEPDPCKIVHTELILESDEFEEYVVLQDTEVTFCLKELRAFLNFLEGVNVPVNIYCQGAGKPIMFSVELIPGVKSEFVLATLAITKSSQMSEISVNENPVPKASTDVLNKKGSKRKVANSSEAHQAKVISDCSLPEIPVNDPEASHAAHTATSKVSECASLNVTGNEIFVHREGNNDIFFASYAGERSAEARDNRHENVEANHDELEDLGVCDEENVIPGTPKRHKFFEGWSQPYESSWPPDPDEILVPASDDDDD